MPRNVLITGCSDGGLGASLAVAFQLHGDRVFATARSLSKMTQLKARGIETIALDVLSEDSLQAVVKEVSSLTKGSLDVLVNNAGGGYSMPTSDAEIGEIQKIFNLNVFSVIRTTQVFLPLLIKSPKGGLLVNHSSSASQIGIPFQATYNATKAAIASYSESLRLELGPFNIKVVDLKTGGVKSNFFQNNNSNAGGVKLPEDSIYELARDKIEAFLNGDMGLQFQPADVWARNVVKDLSKTNPPNSVWRGTGATKVWLGTMVPNGWLDGALKQMAGVDVFEKKLKGAEAKKTK